MKKIFVLVFAVFLSLSALNISKAQEWPATQTVVDLLRYLDSLRNVGAGNFGLHNLMGTFLSNGQSAVFGTEVKSGEYLGFVIVGDQSAIDISSAIYDSRHRIMAEGENYGKYMIVEFTAARTDNFKMQVKMNETEKRASFIGIAAVKKGALFNYMDYINAAKNLEETYSKLQSTKFSGSELSFASDPEYVDDNFSNTYSFCLNGTYYKRNQSYGMTGNGMTKNADYVIINASNAGAKKLEFTVYNDKEKLLGRHTDYTPYVAFNSGPSTLYSYYLNNLESFQDLFVFSCTLKIYK